MILVENVFQHYGIRPVLKHISFAVKAGELVAVMGPNGMGKSTLLAVMAGMLSPQKGYVEIDGKRRRRTEEEELAVRQVTYFLPATPWLPPNITGRAYLVAIGRIYSVEDEHLFEHVDRLFTLFNLTEKADSLISSYSTGQTKKLAVAGALVSEAKVLILDEPFSGGLDPSGLLALRKVLKRLAEDDKITVCMATPVPEFVEELAHRVIVLKDGEVLACATPEELRKQAGCEGNLEEVLEEMINPQTLANVEQYLEGRE